MLGSVIFSDLVGLVLYNDNLIYRPSIRRSEQPRQNKLVTKKNSFQLNTATVGWGTIASFPLVVY